MGIVTEGLLKLSLLFIGAAQRLYDASHSGTYDKANYV